MSKIKTFTKALKFTGYTLGVYSIGILQGATMECDRAYEKERENLKQSRESFWTLKPKKLNDAWPTDEFDKTLFSDFWKHPSIDSETRETLGEPPASIFSGSSGEE